MQNLVGRTIEQYQIIMKLRETGTRVLYRAYDSRTHRNLALEVVKLQNIVQTDLLDLLNKQTRANAKLDHPNIAAMLNSGIWEDTIYLVYNFSPLRTWRRMLNVTHTWQELARELITITHALSHAHEQGVFHGYLNPSSIMLDENRNLILFDFGIEQLIVNYMLARSPGSWMNQWGMEYCSPEQLQGAAVDFRSDVYAIGMILYEWTMGEIPLLDVNPLYTLQKRNRSYDEDLKVDPDLPDPVQKLIQKCIASRPADRFQSMQHVSILLARGALELGITRKMVRNPQILLAPERQPRFMVSIALLLLVLIFGGIGLRNQWFPIFQTSATTTAVSPVETLPAANLSPTQALSTPTRPVSAATSTPRAVRNVIYPLFLETPLVPLRGEINRDNVGQLITISRWGVGDLGGLAVSPNGDYLAAASSIGVFIFGPQQFDLQQYLDTGSSVSAIEVSPDGKTIAVGDQDGLIRFWEAGSWQEMQTLSGHRSTILDLAFSPDGSRLASVALDNTLIQWEINSTNANPTATQITGVNCVAYSADGTMIITGGEDFKVNAWGADDIRQVQSITLTSKIINLTAIRNSSLIAAGDTDRRVTLIDLQGKTTSEPLTGLQYALASLAASSDGKQLAAGDINGGIVVWAITGEVKWTSPNFVQGNLEVERGQAGAHSLAFASDGSQLISVLRDGTIRKLDAASGEEILQTQTQNLHTDRLVISNDGKYVVSRSTNGLLNIWDIPNSKVLYRLAGDVKAGDPFSQDGRYFAFAADASTVKVFDLLNGQEIYTFNKNGTVRTIQFVQDGAQLAVGYQQVMHLWSMSSGQELKTQKGASTNGCSLVLDLNGRPIFSITNYNHIIANDNNSAVLCGFKRVDWMKTFIVNEGSSQAAYGGSSKLAVLSLQGANSDKLDMGGVNFQNVINVAIHPNGELLAAAFDDHTIHFWDITTQQELMRLFGHSNAITDLKFTPDGKILLSASMDGTIRLWGVPQ